MSMECTHANPMIRLVDEHHRNMSPDKATHYWRHCQWCDQDEFRLATPRERLEWFARQAMERMRLDEEIAALILEAVRALGDGLLGAKKEVQDVRPKDGSGVV